MLNRKMTSTSISSNTAAAEKKWKRTNAKAFNNDNNSTMWDLRKNYRKQMVTVISECGLVMRIVYIVFSSSCCKKTTGNVLGLITLSLQVCIFSFTGSVLIEPDLAPLEFP